MKSLILINLVLFLAPMAWAGGVINGGGGNAVLCYANVKTRDQVYDDVRTNRSPFGHVNLQLDQLKPGFKPQLLDLWEARKPVGFPGEEVTPELNDKIPERIYSELKPIIETMGNIVLPLISVKKLLDENRTSPSQWKAEENGVIRIEDATIQSFFPKNCLVAQVAFYNDSTNIVHYDARIVRLMEGIDRSALRIHEDFYRAVRVRGVQLENELVDLEDRIEAAYNSAAYRRGATVSTGGLELIRAAIKKTRNSDLTRQLVANLFATKVFDKETSKKLEEAIVKYIVN